jgi:hypothetical protein
VVTAERELILPPTSDVDLISVQFETLRLNGICTMDLVKIIGGHDKKVSGETEQSENDSTACMM